MITYELRVEAHPSMPGYLATVASPTASVNSQQAWSEDSAASAAMQAIALVVGNKDIDKEAT
jgi:hypothetical protein